MNVVTTTVPIIMDPSKHREKLIPPSSGWHLPEAYPYYGDGMKVRDWLDGRPLQRNRPGVFQGAERGDLYIGGPK